MSFAADKRKRALELALSQRRMLSTLFVALAGLAGVALLVHRLANEPHEALRSPRHPSSVDAPDADFDPDLYAEEAKSQHKRAGPNPVALPFEAVSKPSENLAALASSRTGISGKRAREVVLHSEAFSDTQDEYKVQLNLFQDVAPVVLMQRPSLYGVNHAFLVGQVIGDPSSRVQLMMANGQMNGTIQTHQSTYRIVSLGSGHHYVIELDSPRSKH